MFEDGDVVGAWLCEDDRESFAMIIDDYTSPSQLMGRVCAAWNEADDPLQWEPCGELSAHPIGGGPHLPIYAMISDASSGMTWTVSAGLVYDPETDSMAGQWYPGFGGEGDRDIECKRVE